MLDDELPEHVPAVAEHGMGDQPLESIQVPDPVSPPPEMPGVAQSPFSVASYDSDATVPVPSGHGTGLHGPSIDYSRMQGLCR